MIPSKAGSAALTSIRIALDVMSGDESPSARMCSVIKLLTDKPDLFLYLIGDEVFIKSFLRMVPGIDWSRLAIVHSVKTVSMSDSPFSVLRSKQESSMWMMLELVASGEAHACVSAGNTGALMAMGRHLLQMVADVDRPAIATCIPCRKGSAILLDIGANVDSTAINLHQFAVMGSQLSSSVYHVYNPRVALMNVGTEDIKGNKQVRLASQLIQKDNRINYIGYIEGHAIFSGLADVIVCDGFVGNVALKTAEGVASLVKEELLATFGLNWWSRLLGLAVSPVLKEFCRRVDPVRYNGASFLGLQGIVVKSHGSADGKGFFQAVCQAIYEVQVGVSDCLMVDSGGGYTHSP
ncbi:MAG: phosphate acyltransferase PlsX [Candidatus Endonucleobacter bathymodioli]|uniref:Phosphate acyltransferase n=1 Tax=Candidatus Endonucleibacter bathymodioli TaxID=539814 RepID=A0AA90NZ22_9GAMM|nr:phosphate acyltransferase PlsX [Candidatus Endonucleobacter bathymodioli]